MKRMIIVIFHLMICAAFAAAQESPDQKIDALFKPFTGNVPGCTVGAVQNGKLLFTKAYGMADLEHNVPLTPASPFYMASVSKQVTAMAILLLADDGKLQLSDSIRKSVPELPEYADKITLYHLLTHTSGIRDYLTLGALAARPEGAVFTDENSLRLIARQDALNFEPGSAHDYSNSGYFLLSLVVKRVAGKDLNAFAQERIFGPLAMNSSRFQHEHSALVPGKAFGYQFANAAWHASNSTLDVVGDGGMYSSVEDMLRWAANFNEPKIGAKALPVMQTRGKLSNGQSFDYGMGLAPGEYRGLKTVSHGGGLAGYRTHILWLPAQKFSVVCLCNNGNANPALLTLQVAEIFLSGEMSAAPAAGKPQAGPATAPGAAQDSPAELSQEQQKEFIGEYRSRELEATYRIFIYQGVLTIQPGDSPRVRLLSAGPDLMKIWGRGIDLAFQRDTSGKITGFLLNAGRVRAVRFIRN
jgi:CubicO group peptidase (beta-lactamase class C family)